MIRTYYLDNNTLRPDAADLVAAIWIDICSPGEKEQAEIEDTLGLDIPTQPEMEEIEISSRLYTYENAAFMTAILPANSDGGNPDMGPVTFILTKTHVITVRYHEPRVFSTFAPRALTTRQEIKGPLDLLVALLEAVIDRQADILERAARNIDLQSREIFMPAVKGKPRDYQVILEKIGQMGVLGSNIRDSLLTMERLTSFLGQILLKHDVDADLRERGKTLGSDVKSLADHANFLSDKITFLLDATLGMITIEQNGIIKIFSVAAVIFLPPTLIASMYGMNFTHMPELHWDYGYPYAIGLMALFAVLPYLFAKYKKWL
ncbi:magnesium transporter CorA family protein [Pseudorhodobacter sp.]|uniref:magnesium transporter CorA family protein n=1 Tax=Pseudorhodobacter sp. TaxID=1934400 RepID=UPI002647F7E9|nr:magnesium transporter CorA family protein [Pseudorhodobacter sp.]MDN5787336.1 magnesium transporter CorA family protein [Pseudorhodobacter sp.]